uniref:PiggyBac transposable element-derived protein domain-containing protein n=1 Tax=Phytophthora ramorum TaxID=164328 RepID=H3GHY6_PHYRM
MAVPPPNTKSGPAAVVRNLSVGTVQTDRQGLCKAILPKKLPNGRKESNKRPRWIARGTFHIAEARHVPCLKFTRWWDNQGVFVLAAGGNSMLDRTVRRDKATGEQAEVMCSRFVKDYQSFMGGVDVHDQLRLQRSSLQLARRYKKYYKSLFLGLMDLAIINGFIIYNYRRVADGKSKVSHARFLKELQLQLCQLQDDDWDQLIRDQGLQPTPTKSNRTVTAHVPVQTDEWQKGNGNETRKRQQRACKVCSVLKREDQSRGGETTCLQAENIVNVCAGVARVPLEQGEAFEQRRCNILLRGMAQALEGWNENPADAAKAKAASTEASAYGDAEDSGAQSSEESETGSPPSSRQRTHTTVDGVED